jgi:hypothetical protein
MSYDVYLLQPTPGEDPLATVRAKLNVETEVINPGPPNAEAEVRKQQLTRALIAENPALEAFEFGYAEIARIDGISEEEARVRYRHIELNGPEKGNGIQITLYDDNASITIPYWHQPEAARLVFGEVWRYLRVLRDAGGFFVYDPQLDRVVDLNADLPDVIREYGRVVAKIPEIVEQGKPQSKRPWWKLW